MLTTLDHVVIGVRDLATASTSYERLLGRRPSWRGVHPSFGTANVLFRLENTYIELLAVQGEGPMADWLQERLNGGHEGLCAVAFGTDDAASITSVLRERGLHPTDPIEGSGE